jgi:prohibitin 2
MIHEVYRNLGTDYDGRVLPSVINEVMKSVVAKYNAQSMLTKREEVSHKIRMDLEARLQ